MTMILQIRKLLKSVENMSTKFKHAVIIIEASKDLFKLYISELMSSLEVHRQRLNIIMSTLSLE